MMPDLVGQQFGTYRLIRLLGEGAFAEVYLGEHIHLGIYTAVKVLKMQVASGDIERFRTEARTIANLQNPQIVRVLDFDVQNGTPFLVMEHAPHGTLRQRHPRGSLLPPAMIVPYVKQVAAALQYAHDSNVVHRDVKPENMLLGPANQVWLSDFGIAVIVSTRTSLKETAGTYSYMAPEQIQGHPCPASDQYALGVVVYEWLGGSPPFQGTLTELAMQHMHAPPPPLRQRVPALLPAVEGVVLKALAKDPKQRYASVTDFATDLERACQETVFAPPPPPPPPVEAALVGPFGRITLGPTALHIGRTPDNQLVLNDPQVSKQHAVVHPQGPGHAITDLGSVNGTFVNEQRLPVRVAYLLNAGNTIRVGNTRLSYEVKSMPRPSPIPPFPTPRPPVPPPPPPPRPWLRVALICAAVLILIIAIPTIIINSHRTLAPNATATAQAANNATATAVAIPTTPAIATATAVQTLYTNATSGPPAFNDPLHDNSQNNLWAEGTGCQFTGGAYHVSETQQGSLHNCTAGNVAPPSYFAYQVQMTIVSGDEGCSIFRYTSTNNGQYYAFCIRQDGHYEFIIANNTYTILESGLSAAITPGLNRINAVMVIAQGAKFDLYVNRQFVSTVTDTTFSRGAIGVGVLDDTHATEVIFSNVQVWTPAQATGQAAGATALYNQAISRPPAFNDPLHDNSQNNRWDEDTGCQFTGGAYHASVTQQGTLYYCIAGNVAPPSYFAYQVQMTIVSGDEGCSIFRYTSTNNRQYYAFCLSKDGHYEFIITNKTFTTLESGFSSAIIPGLNRINTVMVIAQGAKFDLYVNRQFVSTVTDTTFSRGAIGVGVLDDTHATDVAFSNAQVWQL